MAEENPYNHLLKSITIESKDYNYYDISSFGKKYDRLPFSIRVLLESAIRNCDNFQVKKEDVEKILEWEANQALADGAEISFKPARVILQDFTGVPAVVDFAAMRDAVKRLGADPDKINPICPSDLVIDHSIQVDYIRSNDALKKNEELEFERNKERFMFLKWGAKALKNMLIVPPGSGIVHQVNLEYLARVVFNTDGLLYPDSVVGTDSHTTMINGLGVLGWGVGGIEAEAVMLGQAISMLVPKVVGYRLEGVLNQYATSTDLVLTITKNLRQIGVVGKFVEFFGPGVSQLSIADRATISNMCPEYGATVGFFPVDQQSLTYLRQTGRPEDHIKRIEKYLSTVRMLRNFDDESQDPIFSEVVTLDLATVVSSVSGPKRPHDRVSVTDMKTDFRNCLTNKGAVVADDKSVLVWDKHNPVTISYYRQTGSRLSHAVLAAMPIAGCSVLSVSRCVSELVEVVDERIPGMVKATLGARKSTADDVDGLNCSKQCPRAKGPALEILGTDFDRLTFPEVGFKGFGLSPEKVESVGMFEYQGKDYKLRHGSVVIAAITSCTNTSNPSVMLGAGLLAKKAVEAGLSVAPYIKTSLSPGSGVVTYYLKESGVIPALTALGFDIVGYGCMTCIGNSGPLPDVIVDTIEKNELVCCGVLSGNRNFEGRIHPNTRANYLASPLLVIAYAIAGTVDIDFEKDPLGRRSDGSPIYLQDIWPTRADIQAVEQKHVIPAMFKEVYSKIEKGSSNWASLVAPEGKLYPWDPLSTYIKSPPYFDNLKKELPAIKPLKGASVLLNLGDSVTTDHISPAGSIARNSPAARYLANRGLTPKEFNSYGSRRGNDAVMARGTFANIRLVNKFIGKPGPRTIHIPTNEEMDVFDAVEKYAKDQTPLIILVGKEYGSGSSRDWAAKGPYLLGIKAVIAESYERIHRSNLVGMGVIPLQYLPGQNAESLGLTGLEVYDIPIPENCQPGQKITVTTNDGKKFDVIVRFDTEVDLTYFKNGGILNYMIRKML